MKRRIFSLLALLLLLIIAGALQIGKKQNQFPRISLILPTTAPSKSEGAVLLTPTPSATGVHEPTSSHTPSPPPTQTSTRTSTALPTSTPTATLTPTSTPIQSVKFAVIGDYGIASQAEADVAALVQSWSPDFVITVGDNNYPAGSADTIDDNVGRDYHSFLFPYTGNYGESSQSNRFFPTFGNHDHNLLFGYQPYLDYFTLPGNERYYDFTWGPVHLFALNSDSNEPDGFNQSSAQAAWLKEQLTNSTAPWNIVYFHHAPYSSALHGSTDWMRWPFHDWGADAILSGHDHTYERLLINDIPYFVNGLGGASIYTFSTPLTGSQMRYNSDYGAMLVIAEPNQIAFTFTNRLGVSIDACLLFK